MSEQSVTTLAMLVLVVALVIAAWLILGPRVADLIHLPVGVLR